MAYYHYDRYATRQAAVGRQTISMMNGSVLFSSFGREHIGWSRQRVHKHKIVLFSNKIVPEIHEYGNVSLTHSVNSLYISHEHKNELFRYSSHKTVSTSYGHKVLSQSHWQKARHEVSVIYVLGYNRMHDIAFESDSNAWPTWWQSPPLKSIRIASSALERYLRKWCKRAGVKKQARQSLLTSSCMQEFTLRQFFVDLETCRIALACVWSQVCTFAKVCIPVEVCGLAKLWVCLQMCA